MSIVLKRIVEEELEDDGDYEEEDSE